MKISYGPPPARGVTQLMAVGDAEYEGVTDHFVKGGFWGALAVAGAGVILGSRTLRDVGLGAAGAMAAIRYYGRRPKVVAVTTQPASGWR